MLLREIAHARAGDKGRLVTISLIAYRDEDYTLIEKQVTADKVGAYFGDLIDRPVDRIHPGKYILPLAISLC